PSRRSAELRATGEIIINSDSDDWFAPNFITRSVTHLMRSGADMTGLSSAYFYLPHSQLWLYQYRGGQPYVLGSGMCYHRHVWQRKPYPDIKVGEDLEFQTNAGRIIPHDNIHLFMAMIHGKNTASHKQLSTMKRINPEIAEGILGESYYLYH